MNEISTQIGLEALAYPAQARKSGAGYGELDAVNERPDAAVGAAGDRYLPSEQLAEHGLYSKASLLENGLNTDETTGASTEAERAQDDPNAPKDPNALDEGDKELVKRLEQRDREVRQHEQAHAASVGEYAEGAPTYSYQRGPDGKMYAIGGSLAVDVGKDASQAENNRKAHILQSSALGVADPSGADAMVAMQANQLMDEGMVAQAAAHAPISLQA